MSYDIEVVSAVIVTANELESKMNFKSYLNLFASSQKELIQDILFDLARITDEVTYTWVGLERIEKREWIWISDSKYGY